MPEVDFARYDSQGMHAVYDRWPDIAADGYAYEHESVRLDDTDHIVFCGMGGSGTIGDMMHSIFSKTAMHVSIVKGYLLPNTVNDKTLVIATSISGDTIETLTALRSASERDCRVLAMSSGGKMEDFCIKNHIDHRKIEQNHSPRASFAGFLYSLIGILRKDLPLSGTDVEQSISELRDVGERISSANISGTNPSLELARWITGIPIIYYPWGLNAAAIRFKNSLQENSKMHAATEDVIEACHNGIVSWEKEAPVQPILLRGRDDYEKTRERWDIIKEYFGEKKIDYRELVSVEGNILSKLISLIYLLDYASIYRSVLSGIDPSPIDSINFVKKRL